MQALKEYHEIAKELLKYLPNYRDEENSLIVECHRRSLARICIKTKCTAT